MDGLIGTNSELVAATFYDTTGKTKLYNSHLIYIPPQNANDSHVYIAFHNITGANSRAVQVKSSAYEISVYRTSIETASNTGGTATVVPASVRINTSTFTSVSVSSYIWAISILSASSKLIFNVE